eukprot:CAMPEP_0117698748 /NCGR_PEP_ID=MMETSP0804-20121206/29918_1 /TAXON_ID=1074897 /ORGANISM="Tetraselmis astigmatica, Strain CCMP880" /LENGTH=100 /DNA_ID=CAMNT_0005513067 /DNA_START=867 /DNA_END=1169 /DNA_ORIENTATION=+
MLVLPLGSGLPLTLSSILGGMECCSRGLRARVEAMSMLFPVLGFAGPKEAEAVLAVAVDSTLELTLDREVPAVLYLLRFTLSRSNLVWLSPAAIVYLTLT